MNTRKSVSFNSRNMYLSELNIILTLCICFANSIGFFGLGNPFRFLLRDIINVTGATFDDTSSSETKWIEQPLDHFNESEDRIWKMKYLESLDFWKKDGPIYLFMYGEGAASSFFLKTGVLYELAKETNGAMFLSEHRYYGESKPFHNFTADNLSYLSSLQALADVANLLQYLKAIPKFNTSKVVVVGGSYAGNLAAWTKHLYPNLVDAAIASSAPVLAKTDFHEYLEHVSDVFEQYGTDGCLSKISDLFDRYDKLFETREGIAKLKEEENICEYNNFYKIEDKQIFFMDKASSLMSIAQYGNTNSIKNYCKRMDNMSRIVSLKEDETSTWNRDDECFSYDFDEVVEDSKNIDWLVAWMFQSCTEFGYFQSSSTTWKLFTKNIPLELFIKLCKALFGSKFDLDRTEEGVKKSNLLYGGLMPNVTNVVFVNGGLDPWSKLSILEDISYDAPSKVISQASHCRDLFSDSRNDPQELIEARKYIKYLIKRWIGIGEFIRPVSY